jgi:hypothetical protein
VQNQAHRRSHLPLNNCTPPLSCVIADTRLSGGSSPADSSQSVITLLSYLLLFAPQLRTDTTAHRPCVFRSVTTTTICRLIGEASELAVHCLIGGVRVAIDPCGRGGSPSIHSSRWALVWSRGTNPLGNPCGGGHAVMFAMQTHQFACARDAEYLRDMSGG